LSEIEAKVEVPVETAEAAVEQVAEAAVEQVAEAAVEHKINQRPKKKVQKNGGLLIFTVVIIIQLST